MMRGGLRLATRASPLALWQARHVADRLRRIHRQLRVELVPLVSRGDVDLASPLYAMETVGIFVKEVQHAVLTGAADAGVHSCKDLPTAIPAGLTLGALIDRADARDALIGAPSLDDLPEGAVIGTSSLRRQAQLAARRPDLRFASVRGNVETRLKKLAAGEYSALVLALAGLKRLDLARSARAVALDPWTECTPAPAQGAIAVDCRAGDARSRWLLASIADRDTTLAVEVERAVLAALDGGCSLPLGCHVRRLGSGWRLRARLGTAGGLLDVDITGARSDLAKRAVGLLQRR